MLELNGVAAYYGAIRALEDISIKVGENTCIAVLGPNGSGKTTLLRVISGLIDDLEGSVSFNGTPLVRRRRLKLSNRQKPIPSDQIVRLGICQVPEGAQLFPKMTVKENLIMGAYLRKNRAEIGQDIEKVFDYFPILKKRLKFMAGNLSGGEQQMLAIGRALLSRPKLLLLDEPSIGLSPKIVKEVFQILRRIRENERCSILLVEQNLKSALEIADFTYLLKLGRITDAAPANRIMQSAQLYESYMGKE